MEFYFMFVVLLYFEFRIYCFILSYKFILFCYHNCLNVIDFFVIIVFYYNL